MSKVIQLDAAHLAAIIRAEAIISGLVVATSGAHVDVAYRARV